MPGHAIVDSPAVMENSYFEQEPSLSQLFDAIERKLDEIMMRTFRYSQAGRCHLSHS